MSETRMKHDYTNELELKSLAIREKNLKLNLGSEDPDGSINEDLDIKIKEYVKTKDPDLKDYIISISEGVKISPKSHEYFGSIVILMIKKILTKPNFSGYTWQDDFYSDACYRVFKYIHNFDHTLKSKITNQSVSCFSYISQIIHNSILAIINEKNKKDKELENLACMYNSEYDIHNESRNVSTIDFVNDLSVDYVIPNFNLKMVENILDTTENKYKNINIKYNEGFISFDDYAELKNVLSNFKHFNVNLTKGDSK